MVVAVLLEVRWRLQPVKVPAEFLDGVELADDRQSRLVLRTLRRVCSRVRWLARGSSGGGGSSSSDACGRHPWRRLVEALSRGRSRGRERELGLCVMVYRPRELQRVLWCLHRNARGLGILDHLGLGRHRRPVDAQLARALLREAPSDRIETRDVLVANLLPRRLDGRRLRRSVRAADCLLRELLQSLRRERIAARDPARGSVRDAAHRWRGGARA